MEHKKLSVRRIIINSIIAFIASLISIFTLSWIYRGASLTKTLNAVQPIYLILAISLVLLNWLVEALRIQKIAEALGEKIGLFRVLEIELMSGFFAKLTPFESGGETFQIYFFHKDSNFSLATSTSIVMVKILLSHLARLSMGLMIPFIIIASKIKWDIPGGLNTALNAGLFLYIFFFSILLIIFFKPLFAKKIVSFIASIPLLKNIHPEKMDRYVNKLHAVVDDFKEVNSRLLKSKTKDLVFVGLYSFTCWILLFLVPVFLLWGLGIKSPFMHVFAIIILFQIASAYAPTPGSSGIAELGFASLFAALVPHSFLFIFVLFWRLITYYMGLFVGGIFTVKETITRHRRS